MLAACRPDRLDPYAGTCGSRYWNFLFGGQWEITKRWQVMAEGGIGNRRQVILGAFFRF